MAAPLLQILGLVMPFQLLNNVFSPLLWGTGNPGTSASNYAIAAILKCGLHQGKRRLGPRQPMQKDDAAVGLRHALLACAKGHSGQKGEFCFHHFLLEDDALPEEGDWVRTGN